MQYTGNALMPASSTDRAATRLGSSAFASELSQFGAGVHQSVPLDYTTRH